MNNYSGIPTKISNKLFIRIIASVLVVVLAVFAVIGCGSGNGNSATEDRADSSAESNANSAPENESSAADESSKPAESLPSTESSQPNESVEPSAPEESSQPESSQPESSEPEDSKPESSEPETSKPETSKPETSKPETSKPESSEPETSKSESSQPETSKPESSQPETSKPETSEPDVPDEDVIGSGTKADPYLAIPIDMKLTTVSIPAEGSVFYSIQRVGGTVMKIKNPNVYVICGDKEYTPENGVISFQIENALANEGVLFEIGNMGSSAIKLEISFSNPTGSQANPTEIKKFSGEYEVSIAKNDSVGYYYSYSVTKTEKIRFYVTGTGNSGLEITRIRDEIPVQKSVDNVTTDYTGTDILVDEQGRAYVEFDVEDGDELIVHAVSVPKRNKYLATDITWWAEYK